MSELDFTTISDEKLLEMENQENKAITQMIFQPELEEHFQKLEAIREEKSRRNLDG